eukprot:scaffold8010_cov69-Phaeocystis_antarctica.AAC.2
MVLSCLLSPVDSRSISLASNAASADGKLSVTDGTVTFSTAGENGLLTIGQFSAGFKNSTFTIDSLSVKVGEVEHKFADGSTEKLTLNVSLNVVPLTFALTGTKTITKTIKHSEKEDSDKITMDPVAEYKLETPEYPLAGSVPPLLPIPPYAFAAQDKIKLDVSLEKKQGSDEATLTITVTVSFSIRPYSIVKPPVPVPPNKPPGCKKPLLPGGVYAAPIGWAAGGVTGGAVVVGGALIGSEVGAFGGPVGFLVGATLGTVGGLLYWGTSAAVNAIRGC